MWFSAWTLFLALAVFLDFLELIQCLHHKTINQLFPGNKGILPAIQTCPMEIIQGLTHFRHLGNMYMEDINAAFLRRGSVIMGVHENIGIYPLCYSFDFHPDLLHIVYDMDKNEYVTMDAAELTRVGQNRIYEFVRERDVAAHLLKPLSEDPVHFAAHIAACNAANHETDAYETELRMHLPHNQAIPPWMIIHINEKYTNTYTAKRTEYLNAVQNNPNRHH